MIQIYLKLDSKAPQLICNACGKCSSVIGRNLGHIKNRGCCFYFPKFNLYEIHKMVKSDEGMDNLKMIIKRPQTKIYNYYIHAVGDFDKKMYYEHMKKGFDKDEQKIKDKTLFFRTCPFVKPKVGCTMKPEFRSYVCNLFLCNEIMEAFKDSDEFKKYIKERDSYSRYVDWENTSIQMYLEERGLDLIHNFDKTIEALKKMPLEIYEFPRLKQIEAKL